MPKYSQSGKNECCRLNYPELIMIIKQRCRFEKSSTFFIGWLNTGSNT